MSSSRDELKSAGKPHDGGGKQASPDWAASLKKLYDSVVEEPLPDTFKDLLSRLDEPEGK